MNSAQKLNYIDRLRKIFNNLNHEDKEMIKDIAQASFWGLLGIFGIMTILFATSSNPNWLGAGISSLFFIAIAYLGLKISSK